jgi:hypothetical protein
VNSLSSNVIQFVPALHFTGEPNLLARRYPNTKVSSL